MLALTCDMELVPGLRDLKTSLLIRHPDEEVGTVPFSFDSDSTLQKICDRLVYQYFEDHITDARLPGTYQNHRNVLEMQPSESSSSDNCTLPTALIFRHQTKAHCSLLKSKTIVDYSCARSTPNKKRTPSHAFKSIFDSYFDHYYSSSGARGNFVKAHLETRGTSGPPSGAVLVSRWSNQFDISFYYLVCAFF